MEVESKFGRFKQSKFFLPVLVLIGAGVLIAGLLATGPKVEEEENEFPPLMVEVSEASLDERLRSSLFQGEVRAKTNIELVTQVTGKVMSVSDKFIEGGEFAANEPILQIDDADYRVALKSAEAAVAEAKVELGIELASAETSKREWLDLVGESIEKANPLRLNKPQVQRSRARLDAAKAQLAQAQLDYSRTSISAPFAGRMLSKSAELGQFVSRGTSVGRVFSTDSVEIRIPMSDLQISELGLTLGQILNGNSLTAKVTMHFGGTDHHWQGYLKSVDASVDRDTRVLFGTVVVHSPFELRTKGSNPLAPGLFVDVELNAAEKVAGVSVPRGALRSGNKVYVVKDSALYFREVETLFTSDEVAVFSVEGDATLLPGDMVVVSPVPGAFDGMTVKVKGDDIEDLVEPEAINAIEPAQAETEEESATPI
jgi:RND family efflux transporter MFP subunit